MRMSKVSVCMAGVAVVMLAVAGCSAPLVDDPGAGSATNTPAPADTGGTSSAGATSAQFVACLIAAGAEARIDEAGRVLVRDPAFTGTERYEVGSSPGGEVLSIASDEAGNLWVAPVGSGYFSGTPDVQEAYTSCEGTHPGFRQPEQAVDPDVEAQLAQVAEAALRFARCARDAGFAWVADPAPDTPTQIAVGPELTAGEFRALLDACYDISDYRTLVSWDGLGALPEETAQVLQDFLPAELRSIAPGGEG